MSYYWLVLAVILGLQLALVTGLALLAFRLRKRLHYLVQALAKGWEETERKVAANVDRANERVIQSNTSALAQIESLMTLNRLVDGQYAFNVPGNWSLRPDILIRLVSFIQQNNPETIVECGSGASTIVIASALRSFDRGGHLISLEHDPHYFETIVKELRHRSLDQYATVVHAPLKEKTYDGFDHAFNWYDLDQGQLPDKIGMIVIDGPPGRVNKLARYPAGPELFNRLAAGAHIFLDDAKREDESQLSHLWGKQFPNLTAQALPTEKGAVELLYR